MTIAYLNGQFLPLSETKISVMDRGFLFGDGVYEVIPVFNRKAFRLEQHLERLGRSLAAIHLKIDLSTQDFQKIIAELIEHNSAREQSIYLQITRGPAPKRDHTFPLEVHPTIFAFSIPLVTKTIAELSVGITAITTTDIRWQRCDIKAITLLANVLLKQEAADVGATEAILIRDGLALEGSISNLYVIKDKTIITPPLNNYILGGVTRELVLELAAKNGIAYREDSIPLADLYRADEVWVSSSSREILPVVAIDSKPVANGVAGQVWYNMIAIYQEFKKNY